LLLKVDLVITRRLGVDLLFFLHLFLHLFLYLFLHLLLYLLHLSFILIFHLFIGGFLGSSFFGISHAFVSCSFHGGLCSLSLFLCFCEHVAECLSVLLVFCILLLLDQSALLSFLLDATASEGFGIAAVIFEDWSIVQVNKLFQFDRQSLPVVLNFLYNFVVLEVKHFHFRHLLKNLWDDSFVIDVVLLQVDTGDALALEQAFQVLNTFETDSVARQVECVNVET